MDILGTQYGPIWDSPGISITSLLMTHRWWCSLSCKHTFSLNPFYDLRTDRCSHFTEERMEDLRGWVTCWCPLNLKGRPRIWVQFVWQKVCGFRFVHLLSDAPHHLPLCDQQPLPALNHRLKKKKKITLIWWKTALRNYSQKCSSTASMTDELPSKWC